MLQFYTEILQLPGERLEEFAAGRVPFPSVRLSADSIIDLFPKKMVTLSIHAASSTQRTIFMNVLPWVTCSTSFVAVE